MIRHPPLPSAFDMLIVSPSADPFKFVWRPPGQRIGQSMIPGSAYTQVTSLTAMPMRTGYSMHPGDQTENPQPVGLWHHVSVEPRERLLPAGTTLDGLSIPPIESDGNRASILKARIKIAMGNGRTRSFDFDIGAGVEFDVRAYAVLGIDALIPDPESQGAAPEDLTAFALGTILTTTCYCSSSDSTQKNPLTYSQSFVSSEAVGSFRFAMPVMPDAREAQLFLDGTTLAGANAMIFGFAPTTGPIITTTAPGYPIVELGRATIAPDQTSTDRVLIPGGTNVIAVESDAGQMTGTLVQVLNT